MDDDIDLRLIGRKFQAGTGCLTKFLASFLGFIALIPSIFGLWGLMAEGTSGDTLLVLSWAVSAWLLIWVFIFLAGMIERGSRVSTIFLTLVLLAGIAAVVWNFRALQANTGQLGAWMILAWLGCHVLFAGVALVAACQLPDLSSRVVPGSTLSPATTGRNRLRRWCQLALTLTLFGLGVAGGLGALVLKVTTGFGLPFGLGTFVLGGPFFLLAGLSYRRSRKLQAASVAEVRAADQRAPILLLRSFGDDCLPIAGKISWRSAVPLLGKLVTFEEVLTNLLWRFGPVIAIGRPGEPLPPAGAAREYVSHDQWQHRVQELMREATMIVVVLGRTPGVAWEYESLLRHGLAPKMLIVMPPRESQSRERWHRFAATPGLKLTPPPLPTTVDQLLLATLSMPVPNEECQGQYVLSVYRDERAYEEALQSEVVEKLLHRC